MKRTTFAVLAALLLIFVIVGCKQASPAAPTLESISVSGQTTTVSLSHKDTYDTHLTELVVTAKYSDGSETIIPKEEYEVDWSEVKNATGTGTVKVTVSYNGVSTSFDVAINNLPTAEQPSLSYNSYNGTVTINAPEGGTLTVRVNGTALSTTGSTSTVTLSNYPNVDTITITAHTEQDGYDPSDAITAYFYRLKPVINVAENGAITVSGVTGADLSITVGDASPVSSGAQVTAAGKNTIKVTATPRSEGGTNHTYYLEGSAEKTVTKLSAPTIGPFVSTTTDGKTTATVTITPNSADSSVSNIAYHYTTGTADPTQSSDPVVSDTTTFTNNNQTVKIIASVDGDGSYVNSDPVDATVYVLAAPTITAGTTFSNGGVNFTAGATTTGSVYYYSSDPKDAGDSAKEYQADSAASPAGTVYARIKVVDSSDSTKVLAWSAPASATLSYTVDMKGTVDGQEVVVFYVGDYTYSNTNYKAMAVLKAPLENYNNSKYQWGSYGTENQDMKNRKIGGGLANSNSTTVNTETSEIYKDNNNGTNTIWTQLKNFRTLDGVKANASLWFIPNYDEQWALRNNSKSLTGKTWPHGNSNDVDASERTYWASNEYSSDSSNDASNVLMGNGSPATAKKYSTYYLEFCRALQ